MKYLLICVGIFLSSLSYSQSWKALNDSLIYYYNSGLYEKSIVVGEKAVLAAKQEFGEKHKTYVLSLYNLAESYEGLGNYKNAETNYLKGLAVEKELFGESHPGYVGSLRNVGQMYVSAANYAEAEKIFLEVKNKWNVNPGAESRDYTSILNDLGELYKILGRYTEAELLINDALEKRGKIMGKNHPGYNQTLELLSNLYKDMGDYKKALPGLISVLEFTKEAYGENSSVYARRANNLATLYHDMGDLKNAKIYYSIAVRTVKGQDGEELNLGSFLDNYAGLYEDEGVYDTAAIMYQQALELIKSVVGTDHPDYATVLNNYAGYYNVTGQYPLALQYYTESLEINKRVFGYYHTLVAGALHNQGQAYMRMGEYSRAEPVFAEAVKIRKKVLGESHPAYISALSGLASFYQFTGRYDKAEPLFLQALEIRKQTLGEAHPDYARSQNSLAEVYENMGQVDKAEKLLLDAIAVRKRVLGMNHPDYAISVKALGSIYSNAGKYEKAEPYLLEAINSVRLSLGEKHMDYANSIHELALLYKNMWQPDKAVPLMVKSNEIWGGLLGEMHPLYSLGLHNLALVYDMKGEYEKAEKLLLRVNEINGKVMDHNSPNYAITLNTLAKVYMNLGHYGKAEPLFLERNRITVKNLLNNFTVLSENEKGNYLLKIGDMLQENNSFLIHNPSSSTMKTNNFNQQLLFKSLTLADTRNLLNAVRNSQNASVKNLFRNWQTNKAILAKQYSLQVNDRMKDLAQIEAAAEAQEKELTRLSVAFRTQDEIGSVSQADVRANLADNEVAIEFVRFRLFDKSWSDSIIYAAYILSKKDSVPVFISLFEEKRLQQLIDSAGKNSFRMADNFYRGLGLKNKGSSSLGAALYQLIWQPLEPHLSSVKKIAYSPAGKLYGIAFHALSVDSSTLLMDKYLLQQFSTTRNLTSRSNSTGNNKPDSIVLFGDPKFSMDSSQLVKQKNANTDPNLSTTTYSVSTRSTDNNSWTELSGTAQEVETIQRLFTNNKGHTKIYTRASASEDNLKKLDGKSPQIIHIATHGFFLPDLKKQSSNDSSYEVVKDPLLRSGLIFSGANYAWSGKTPIDGVEDGIATAYEISQLNLSTTELVVLSACETALGDVKGSEGVFGLQRAFKMAGVKKMIVSLWQVPDKETAELMVSFYSYWMKGKTINDAFTQAQADMRKKYSPFYWAAFVLIE